MKVSDISQQFRFEDGNFLMDRVNVREMANEVQTPLYVYDAATIEGQYLKLKNNLPESFDIFYAIKANPNLAIIDLLSGFGAGFEVASRGELLACIEAGVEANQIIFAGPVKSQADLETAIDLGIHSINVERINELYEIREIAKAHHKVVDVSLRVNPNFSIDGAIVQMGGGSKKFGIDQEKIEEAINIALDIPEINLIGIHVYAATGISDTIPFLQNIENTLKVAEKANRLFPVTCVDVGGGLGIPYSDEEKNFDMSNLKPALEALLERFPFIQANNTQLIIEPGRFLVGQSGIYVTKVLDVKDSRGKKYILTDGGVHHLLRPALIGSNHPVFNLSNRSGEQCTYDIGGPLCTSIDMLAKNVELPEVQAGDLIGVFVSGAYGYTESMPFFLSHAIPPEVLVDGDAFHIIRDRIEADYLLKFQYIPSQNKLNNDTLERTVHADRTNRLRIRA